MVQDNPPVGVARTEEALKEGSTDFGQEGWGVDHREKDSGPAAARRGADNLD